MHVGCISDQCAPPMTGLGAPTGNPPQAIHPIVAQSQPLFEGWGFKWVNAGVKP